MPKPSSRILITLILIGILLLSLGIRLIDLSDPPLDFNPTRQMRSAIIARGLYYENTSNTDPERLALAVTHMNAMERLEPPILESLVAFTYGLMKAEHLWVARVFVSVFWLIGALFLFDLGRRMTSPLAALVGVSIFLFLPFSIRASRSFQPDPVMVTLIILTAWALYLWQEKRTWKWALLAGLFGGLAVLVKIVAVFFVAGLTLGVVPYALGFGKESKGEETSQWRLSTLKSGLRDPRIWVMAVFMVTPALVYYLWRFGETDSGSFLHWTILTRWREVLTPSFYMRWMVYLDDILGLVLIIAALVGSLVTTPRNQAFLWGFWGGYLIFGLFFPYHIITHDYYHLPLVALISLSLMPLVNLVIGIVIKNGKFAQIALVAVLVLFFAYHGWIGRSIIVGQDFRDHPEFWQSVGENIPADAKSIGLSQDYGMRLMYYGWRTFTPWSNNTEPEVLPELAERFSYFVVTAKNQMSEPLAQYLETHYPIHAEGPGYIIYGLTAPLTP